MAAMDDFILLLHATDAVSWAQFISTRLAGPQYNITSISKDVMTLKSEAYPSSSFLAEAPAVTSSNTNADNDNAKDTNTSRDSGRCSRNAVTETSSIPECISSCKACVVFVSPDFLEMKSPLQTDVMNLDKRSTVYLLLGVEVEETRAYFAQSSEHVFSSSVCVVDGSERSIINAMYEIIHAYENPCNDDEDKPEDIYEIPPPPKQSNRIVKVFPRQLLEKDRDVYVLLERKAEDDVIAVLDVDMTQEVLLTCVCGQLYTFTLPDELKGEIKFKIECQTQSFGTASIKAYDQLGLFNSILKDLVDPLTFITSALNLKKCDTDDLDMVLAFRLQQLASSTTFKTMFPCEEVLNNLVSDEPCKVKYPSLLHFAADWNLRLFCSELLHFPGMLSAACTENMDGDTPCQIAAKKGFLQLEKDLLHFVQDFKGVCGEPLASTPTTPALSPKPLPPLPPATHSRKSPGYVNERVCPLNSSDYVVMAGTLSKKPLLDQQTVRSDSDLMSPTSDCSDNVFESSSCLEDSYANQKIDFSESFDSTLSLSTPSKAYKVLGANQTEIQSLIKQYSASMPGADPMHLAERRLSVSSNCENPAAYIPIDAENAHNAKKFASKIKSLFKPKIQKKSASEDNGTKHGLNKSYSNRSNKSTKSVSSESQGSSKKKKNVSDDFQERDSGSFSDEEKSSPKTTKRYVKPKTFKERDRPMERTLSKRAQSALNEKIEDAPTLPRTDRKSGSYKGSFKSFIQDENSENF